MNRIKKFVKDNKKPLAEIAGFAILDLCVIAAYTMVCNSYGYKMTKPLTQIDGVPYVKDIFGKEYMMIMQKK